MIGRWRETPNSVYLYKYIPIMENIETADFADAIKRELYSRSVITYTTRRGLNIEKNTVPVQRKYKRVTVLYL